MEISSTNETLKFLLEPMSSDSFLLPTLIVSYVYAHQIDWPFLRETAKEKIFENEQAKKKKLR